MDDSVVTLDLTINNSNTGTDVITACTAIRGLMVLLILLITTQQHLL